MPIPVPSETRCRTRTTRDFGGLYAALVLLSFHGALVIYVNSSFLEQYFDTHVTNFLYITSSLLTVVGFLRIAPLLNRFGAVRLTLVLSVIEGVVLAALPFATDAGLVAFLFVIHQAVVPLIFYPLDVLMESLTGDCEKETGGRRGLFLTIMSLTIAISALLSGYLIGDRTPEFTLVYLAASFLLVPFLTIVIRAFIRSPRLTVSHYHIFDGLSRLRGDRDIRAVFSAHFILQIFFAWMVIYTPVYLSTQMGFDWEEIGQILFVGLMAYVFLEYIIGLIADNFLGEKEMMALGFLIMAVSTSWFLFLSPSTLGLWMIAMFMTRVGASLVEATTESYFFKHTTGNDSALISFFRITRPLSYVVGALLGSVTLAFLPMNLLFLVLGILMLPGFFFAMRLRDTR